VARVITLDGVARTVVVERTADGFVVSVDGRRHVVRNVDASAGTIAFHVEHGSYVAEVSNGPGGAKISVGGRSYALARETADVDRPARAGGAATGGRLEAPMPGVVIAVQVSVGDAVKAGQPLVVLESMKMHNEIESPVDGVVQRVNCRVGEQVGYGHLLVEIGTERL
jgi:3-methylcrotonyl-CoA carboxylase alpha subunit